MKLYQSACAAMTAPTVNVQLLSSTDSITAVVSQPADGTICRNAAIDDCQMQKVELALCDAGIAKLPCFGEDPLCVFDVWPEARAPQHQQHSVVSKRKVELGMSREHASSTAHITSSLCLHATWTQGCSGRLLPEGRQRPPSHALTGQSGFCRFPCRLCWLGKLRLGPVLAQPSCTTVLVPPCLLDPSAKQANRLIWI